MSWKPFFARTLGRRGAPLHFAAHSHHPWPDCTFEAQQACWRDAAELLDGKWEKILGEVKPQAQDHVARLLNLSDPLSVTFAPNTHDLMRRILSCLPFGKPVRVLTSDAEFMSFARQSARLAEDGAMEIETVKAEPFDTFAERFCEAASRGGHDLVWLSHVFYNSGFVVPVLEDIVAAVPDAETFIVIDGYHSFMALPVDFRPIEDRAFYLAGGYKYAMVGEGVCFLHAPAGYGPRPRDTGWYAAFTALTRSGDSSVPYAEDASRFDGATFDPSALYRFNAVQAWLRERGLTVDQMTAYVRRLQMLFLTALREDPMAPVHTDQICADPRLGSCGRFLTFRTPHAGAVTEALRRKGVIVDYRADRLRLGFGIYHSEGDIDRLIQALRAASHSI